MPPPLTRVDPLLAELRAVVSQIRVYERRAGRPAARVAVAVPALLLGSTTPEAIAEHLRHALAADRSVQIEIVLTDGGTAHVHTADFDL